MKSKGRPGLPFALPGMRSTEGGAGLDKRQVRSQGAHTMGDNAGVCLWTVVKTPTRSSATLTWA